MNTPGGNEIHLFPDVALVTGASGFIGSHVVRTLLEEGVKVRALVRDGAPLHNLDGLEVERVPGDLLDAASLRSALTGCDTVFHVAAIDAHWLPQPSLMYRVNVEGTIALLQAARAANVRRFVHTSAMTAIGTLQGEAPADETTAFNHWDTVDHHVLSKYMSDLEALRFNLHGLPVVVVNPTFPLGSNDIVPTPTGILIQRYISGQNPFVFPGGMNLVHVRDVARGHLLAALRGRPGERYILGGQNITHYDFAQAVTRLADVKPPQWELYSTERYLYFDISKARRELGYEPGPIEDALAEAVRWFRTCSDKPERQGGIMEFKIADLFESLGGVVQPRVVLRAAPQRLLQIGADLKK